MPLYYLGMSKRLIILLKNKKMSVYECSKISGIPYTTLLEIVNGKTSINKCSFETVYKLALTFNTPMETFYERCDFNSFELFKSEIKHRIKEQTDFGFLTNIYLNNDEIRKYWNESETEKALYLLATVDYLSRYHGLPLAKKYDDIRKYKLKEPLLPADLFLMQAISKNSEEIAKAINESIPEFKQFNIVEGDLRNAA